MDNITFRVATLKDLPTLLQFEQGVIIAERPFNPTLREGAISYYDIPALITGKESTIIVGLLEDKLVASGYARLKQAAAYFKHTTYAHLGFMYVDPKYRGKGINQQLIQQLLNWAKARNVSEVRLKVYEENAPAIRAYKKMGFEKIMVEMRLGINKL